MAVERRRSRRYAREDMGVAIKHEARELRDPELFVRDICRDGMGFNTPEPVSLGQLLPFRIELPAGPVSGTAAVRWVERADHGYRCGVEFRGVGFLHRFRLRGFLEREAGELVESADRLLTFAAVAVALFVALELLGVDLAGPAQLLDFLGR